MARRSNQKLKLLYLSKILLEQTDEQKGLTLSQIITELEKYGIQCGRKCLYDDIEALRVFGIDVKTKRDRYVRYYVASRSFGYTERKLLCELVASWGYIGEKKALDLIKKISEFSGSAQVQGEEITELIDKNAKLPNDELYKNIDIAVRAIQIDKMISFKYFAWNSQKQRKLLFEGEYLRVSPWKLSLKNGKYELLAFDEANNRFVTFLPERMLSASILKQKRMGAEALEGALADKIALHNIRMRCSNSLASEVFEHFGLDVTILANREEWFEFSAKTVIDDKLFAWLFLHADEATLISPDWAIEQFSHMLGRIKQ